MRLLQSAGRNGRLRFVRQNVHETTGPGQRYAVRLVNAGGAHVLYTGPTFHEARLKFLEEADARHLMIHPFAGRVRSEASRPEVG